MDNILAIYIVIILQLFFTLLFRFPTYLDKSGLSQKIFIQNIYSAKP